MIIRAKFYRQPSFESLTVLVHLDSIHFYNIRIIKIGIESICTSVDLRSTVMVKELWSKELEYNRLFIMRLDLSSRK